MAEKIWVRMRNRSSDVKDQEAKGSGACGALPWCRGLAARHSYMSVSGGLLREPSGGFRGMFGGFRRVCLGSEKVSGGCKAPGRSLVGFRGWRGQEIGEDKDVYINIASDDRNNV